MDHQEELDYLSDVEDIDDYDVDEIDFTCDRDPISLPTIDIDDDEEEEDIDSIWLEEILPLNGEGNQDKNTELTVTCVHCKLKFPIQVFLDIQKSHCTRGTDNVGHHFLDNSFEKFLTLIKKACDNPMFNVGGPGKDVVLLASKIVDKTKNGENIEIVSSHSLKVHQALLGIIDPEKREKRNITNLCTAYHKLSVSSELYNDFILMLKKLAITVVNDKRVCLLDYGFD